MRLAIYIALLLVWGGTRVVTAQVVTTMPTTPNSQSVFLYEVKLAEEFIERFNDDTASYIRQQSRALYGTDNFITRPRMLRSLLNKKQAWTSDTAQFFNTIMNSPPPVRLQFTDSTWYADVRCTLQYRNKKMDIHLLLHIRPMGSGHEWSVAGISNCALFADMPAGFIATPRPPSGDYIPTSAYGTDFAALPSLLTRNMHEADFFDPQLLATPKGAYLAYLVKQGEVTIQSVKPLHYYFFQVPGFIFSIERFKRKDSNCGWLISSLQKAADDEKRAFLALLLYP